MTKIKPHRQTLAVVSDFPAPPHAVEAEQSLIGTVLVNPDRVSEVVGLVTADDFYNDSNRRIWRHIVRMHEAGNVIDVITVADRITQSNEEEQTGGLPYLVDMAGPSSASSPVASYARLIRDRAQRRELMACLVDIGRIAEGASALSAFERFSQARSILDSLQGRLSESEVHTSVLDVSRATMIARDAVFRDELVEDVLALGGVSVVYGASNSGKTFFAIDLAGAIAQGIQWNGKNTRRAAVLYLATESPSSVRNRISAYMDHHGLTELDVFVAAKPINLFESDADVARVVAEVEAINAAHQVEIGLIVGDTMARIAAGANENAGEDMSVVMANADKLIRGTGCAFLWIHHSGKDETKGARGWSGIRAHIDTEIEIKDADEQGVHSAEIMKQRDLQGKGTRFGFRLAVKRLGLNAWGNWRTTCVVTPEIAPERPRGGRPDSAGPAILLYLEQKGCGARMKEIVDALDGKVARSKVYEGVKRLAEAGKVSIVSGIVGVIG